MNKEEWFNLGLQETDWLLNNGVIGIPAVTGDGADGKDIVMNGVFMTDGKSAAKKRPVAFRMSVELFVNQKQYLLPGRDAVLIQRQLDFSRGLCAEEYLVTADTHRIAVRTECFVSQLQKELFVSRISVKAEEKLTVRVRLRLRQVGRTYWVNELTQENEDALCLMISAKPSLSENPIVLCSAVGCWSDDADLMERKTEDGLLSFTYEASTELPFSIEQTVLCFMSAGEESRNLPSLALQAAGRARDQGFDSLAGEERGYWTEFWSKCEACPSLLNSSSLPLKLELYHLNGCMCADSDKLLPMIGRNHTETEAWEAAVCSLPVFLQYAGKPVDAYEWLNYTFETALRSSWKEILLSEQAKERQNQQMVLTIAQDTVKKSALLVQAAAAWMKSGNPLTISMTKCLHDMACLCREVAEVCAQEQTEAFAAVAFDAIGCIDYWYRVCQETQATKASASISDDELIAFLEKNKDTPVNKSKRIGISEAQMKIPQFPLLQELNRSISIAEDSNSVIQ